MKPSFVYNVYGGDPPVYLGTYEMPGMALNPLMRVHPKLVQGYEPLNGYDRLPNSQLCFIEED